MDTSRQQDALAKSKSASLPGLALLHHLCSRNKPVMHAAYSYRICRAQNDLTWHTIFMCHLDLARGLLLLLLGPRMHTNKVVIRMELLTWAASW